MLDTMLSALYECALISLVKLTPGGCSFK